MSFQDSFTSSHGTVSFYENEILEQTYPDGSQDYDILYRAREGGYYYEIDTESQSSSKLKIEEGETDIFSKTTITPEEVDENLLGIKHSLSSFLEKATSTYLAYNVVEESVSHYITNNGEDYDVLIQSGTTSRHTYETTLTFDLEGTLLRGEFFDRTWSEENYDVEEGAPIDETKKPESEDSLVVAFTAGDRPSGAPKFDRSPYFVESLGDIRVYTEGYGGKEVVEAGQYLNIEIESYAPATALDIDDFDIIAVEDETIIGKVSEYSSSYKALKPGTTTVTIGDPLGLVTKDVEVTVVQPMPTSVYIDYNAEKELEVDEILDISYEVMPEEALQDVTATSSDESVLKVLEVDLENNVVKVQGVKEGTATLTVESKADPTKTATLDMIVTPKKVHGDASFLIGTWTGTTDIFETTFTFHDDFTGSVEQKVESIAVPNSATFTYEYVDGKINFTTWESEDDTIREPTSVTYDSESGILSITARCLDDWEDLITVNMKLTKATSPLDFLLGKWTGYDEYDSNPINLYFEDGGQGRVEAGYNFNNKGTFTYTYSDGVLAFQEWDYDYYYNPKNVKISEDKTTIAMELEDDWGFYDYTFTKAEE